MAFKINIPPKDDGEPVVGNTEETSQSPDSGPTPFKLNFDKVSRESVFSEVPETPDDDFEALEDEDTADTSIEEMEAVEDIAEEVISPESDATFDTIEADVSLDTTVDFEEDVYNPLLDDDDEEIQYVQVVPIPELNEEDQVNKKRREAIAEEQLQKSLRPERTEKLKSDYDAHALQEVKVDEKGREKKRTRKSATPSTQPKDENTGPSSLVIPLTEDGSQRWQIRPEAGRLDPRGIDMFTQLNISQNSAFGREELREIFSKADSKEELERKRKLVDRALSGDEKLNPKSRRRFTAKDREVLRYLAMFKFANAKHIARIHQIGEVAMLKRLRNLEKMGLIKRFDLYGAKMLWYLSEAGHIVGGMETPRMTAKSLTYTTLPHSFVVNHVAGCLIGGGVNVLALDDFPARNRKSEKGDLVWGEEVVSELEIQSSFSSIKQSHKSDVYRPLIEDERNKQFARWKREGGVEWTDSPEFENGNEFMWTLIPPASLRLAYHVPDLVLRRRRDAKGRPRSIAIEVELANKPYASYERTLQAYKYDTLIYEKVVWVVKSRGAARKLEEAAIKLGIWDDERVDIVPILTEDGVFKGKAEWTL